MKHQFISLQREPLTTAAIIGGGAALAGAGAQAYASGKINKRTEKYNKWAMEQQRQWALSDWEKQNAYNSPEQQMRRLKEAGLNPHLIYGSGSATNTASNVASTPTPDLNLKVPDVESIATGPVNAYMEMRSRSGQQKLIDAQTLKVLSEVDSKNFDLEQKKRLADTQASILTEMLTGKRIENKLQNEENLRRNLMTTSNLAEAMSRMTKTNFDMLFADKQFGETLKNNAQNRKKVQAEIDNLVKDGIIKQFEIELNKRNLTKGDPAYIRVMSAIADWIMKKIQGISDFKLNPGSILESIIK